MAFWDKKYTHVSSDVYVSYVGDPKKYFIRDAVLGSLREGMDMGDAIRAAIIDRYAGSPGMIFYYAKNQSILPYLTDGLHLDPTPYQYFDGSGTNYGDDVNVCSRPIRVYPETVHGYLAAQNPDDNVGTVVRYQAGAWDMHFAVLALCPQSVVDKYFEVGDRLLYDVAWYFTGGRSSTDLPYIAIATTERIVDPSNPNKYIYNETILGYDYIVHNYYDIPIGTPIQLPPVLMSGTWEEKEKVMVEKTVTNCTSDDPPVCTTKTIWVEEDVVTTKYVFEVFPYLVEEGHILGKEDFFNQPFTTYQSCENCSETTFHPGTNGSAKKDWNNDEDFEHPELLKWKAGVYPTPAGDWIVEDDEDGGSQFARLEGRGILSILEDLVGWKYAPEDEALFPVGSRCIQAITTTGYYEAFAHTRGNLEAIPRSAYTPDFSDELNDKLLPIFPIMLNKQEYKDWGETNSLRKQALVLSRRMGMPASDMIASLKNNEQWDDFDDIHEGYLANILSEDTFVSMYVFEFFNQMRLRAEYGPMEMFGSMYVEDPWNNSINIGDAYESGILGGYYEWDDLELRRNKLGFATTSGQFKSLVGWDAIEVFSKPDKFSDELLEINPRHTEVIVKSSERMVTDEIANGNNNNLGTDVVHFESSQVIIRQQVAGANIVREIHIFGLVCFNGVKYNGDWRLSGKKIDYAVGDIRILYEDEEANKAIIEKIPTQMYVPVSWGIIHNNLTKNKEMQVQVMYACKAVMINALTITVNSWWKEKFLPVLIAIIVIVATFYGLGALAQAFAAGMAAGALAVLQMIAIKIAFQTLSSYLIKRFPGTMGKILGAIALVIGDVLSGSFDGSSIMQITAIVILDVVHAVQESIDNEFKVLQNDIANFDKIMNEADKALDKMQEEMYPGAVLDPDEASSMGRQYAYIGTEDVDTFFQRTTMQDPGDMANEAIYNWVDTSLQLPEYSGAGKK